MTLLVGWLSANVSNALIEKKYKKRHERKHQQESDAAIKVDPVPTSMIGMHYQESTGSEGLFLKF